MAIYFDWALKIGQVAPASTYTFGRPDTANDFTSRLLEASVDMAVGIGQLPSASASITIDNSDGAFTPFGGGTYEDFDWLAQVVWLYPKTGTNPASLTERATLFSGIVSDVRYEDDGFTSTVTLECDDPFTIFNRNILLADRDIFLSPQYSNVELTTILFGGTYSPNAPTYGKTNIIARPFSDVYASEPAFTYPHQQIEYSADEGTPIADIIADFANAEHGVMLPAQVAGNLNGNTANTGIGFTWIARDRLSPWTAGNFQTPHIFEFVETTPTGTQFPFRSPTVGFNIDEITTTASCTIAGAGAVTQTAENTTSTSAYGTRGATFSALMYGYDSQALTLAEHLVARYDTVQYGVTGLTITGGMITSKCADTALEKATALVEGGMVWDEYTTIADDVPHPGALYQKMEVSFTGAGGVNLDSDITFFRASYTITPTDWELTLSDGRPAVTSFGFIVGETNYGVLGKNKVS